ncbi:carbohydrate binding protein with CBM9 domain [Mucilaginibacter frigoritolerans]|uniref:Carbohydrate binding protein with CBM9 domain n=1 Tax=Mucilaginibacter frigoritolerans TaxID=652788 RepID=A0A562TX51_9SPHI|nr:ethylbenzene dehydrogenase-related protein [Mucilaginibacter frigoritolerans]TWI98013.1 carbohydrate binding protein with CBM9 domain [Mucilaginibacter frigoritolerans]
MKFLQDRKFWVTTSLILILGYVVSCTKKDQVVINNAPVSTSTLVSVKTASAPIIDGSVDGVWANAPKLEVTATVPDPGNGTFEGYIGLSYNITLRSLYDANNVYFLVQWNDPDESLLNTPVTYNPTTKLWTRQSSNYTFDVNGNITSVPFNEDKFGFQWNINNSVALFASQSCYATCHLNTATQTLNASNVLVTSNPSAGGNHYTNGPEEKADLWHIHLMQDQAYGFADDDYIDWAGGQVNANGRHSDGAMVTSTTAGVPTYSKVPGSVTNTQTLKITGTSTSVTVPGWVVKNQTNGYALLTNSITAGVTVTALTNVTAEDGSTPAFLVTAVDANGVLTLSDGTTIDPTATTAYNTTFDNNGNITGVGANAIPGLIMQKYQGSRSDIPFKAVYTGSGWILELKRALKTADTNLQDVDFSPLSDVNFGIAVFNKASTAHAIEPGLTLHFKQ